MQNANAAATCDEMRVMEQPGTASGHIMPGAFFLLVAVMCIVSFPSRRRYDIAFQSKYDTDVSFPLLPLPLAVIVVVIPLLGIWFEYNEGFFVGMNNAKCFREFTLARSVEYKDELLKKTVNKTIMMTTNECGMVTVGRVAYEKGHLEHIVLYAMFIPFGVINVVTNLLLSCLSSEKAMRCFPPRWFERLQLTLARHALEDSGASVFGLISAVVAFDRVYLAFVFYASSLIWNNHATAAMVEDPCLTQETLNSKLRLFFVRITKP